MFPPFLYDYDPTKIVLSGGSAQLVLPTTVATLVLSNPLNVNVFLSLTESVTKSGSDDVTYQMFVDGVLKYWSGSAWVTSNGSYAQSNAAAVVNTNAATLITSPPKSLKVYIVLKGSGSTTPLLNNLIVSYDNTPVFTSISGQCTVFCYLRDIVGEDLTVADNNPKLVAVNDTAFFNNNFIVPTFYKEASFTTDLNGLIASLSLTQTEDVNQKIRFMVTYEPSGNPNRQITIPFRPCVIPNLSQADLTEISSLNTNQLI